MSNWKKYLLWFAQEHVDFRAAEIESIVSAFNLPMRFVENPTKEQPYWIVEFPTEKELKILASRSVSLRSCQELWANTKDRNTLHNVLKNIPKEKYSMYFCKDKSFKIEVETFCRHLTQQEKIDIIEEFSYFPVCGPVSLKNPDICMQYIEYYGTEPNNSPEKPYQVFFGRWISNGLRQLIQKLSLKTRKFIGNTSMDAQLSLLMANQAQIKPGDLCLDPFVGSGSLLISAAQFGGYVLGTDIDYLMLHAKSRPTRIKQTVSINGRFHGTCHGSGHVPDMFHKRAGDESVLANMKQYGLEHQYLDVIVNDFALPLWKDGLEFDAIITDPPYGIRESTERVGIHKENYQISEKHLATHIPAKVIYSLPKLYIDLLKFSARYLRINKRLVCWFPVFREDYNESCLPSHPCLKLIGNSEQILSKYASRRLLTYQKVKEVDESLEGGDDDVPADFREKYFNQREDIRRDREKSNKKKTVQK